MEQKRGFVHDMLDIKVLTLYALSLFSEPVAFPTLLEVCLQDDGVNYFELQEAVTQLENSGHLAETDVGTLFLTDQGRTHGQLTQDSLAVPLRQRVTAAVSAWKAGQKRQSQVQTEILQAEDLTYQVQLTLRSPVGKLMELQLPASSLKQARSLRQRMNRSAEALYAQTLALLLQDEAEDG